MAIDYLKLVTQITKKINAILSKKEAMEFEADFKEVKTCLTVLKMALKRDLPILKNLTKEELLKKAEYYRGFYKVYDKKLNSVLSKDKYASNKAIDFANYFSVVNRLGCIIMDLESGANFSYIEKRISQILEVSTERSKS